MEGPQGSRAQQSALLEPNEVARAELPTPGHGTHPALVRLSRRIMEQRAGIRATSTHHKNPYSRSCFPAGTQILLADRTSRPIEAIRIGDKVLGFNGADPIPTLVYGIETPLRDHLYTLTFSTGSTLQLTREHPLFTRDGWKSLAPASTLEEVPALLVGTLQVGHQVLSHRGSFETIVHIAFEACSIGTFNLQNRADNYFANGFLAHTKAQMALCGHCAIGFADFACVVGSLDDCRRP
jgi:hypothetical protein